MQPRAPGSVHHLAVCVRDLERALRFYRDVLGLSVRRSWTRDDGTVRSYWLGLEGEVFLALERVEGGPARADDASGWHCVALSIGVEERAAWRAHLAESGFVVERESAFTLYVRGPEGALVGLSHYPDPAPE